jgi:hypothetical protein
MVTASQQSTLPEVAWNEADEAFQRILGPTSAAPRLEGLGLKPIAVRQVEVPGGPLGAMLVFAKDSPAQRSFVGVLAVPDREQYMVYSPFGRQALLPPLERLAVQVSGYRGEARAFLWSDAAAVYAIYSTHVNELDEAMGRLIGGVLGEPAAPFTVEQERPAENDGADSPTD